MQNYFNLYTVLSLKDENSREKLVEGFQKFVLQNSGVFLFSVSSNCYVGDTLQTDVHSLHCYMKDVHVLMY